jgi:hypothetical protein
MQITDCNREQRLALLKPNRKKLEIPSKDDHDIVELLMLTDWLKR